MYVLRFIYISISREVEEKVDYPFLLTERRSDKRRKEMGNENTLENIKNTGIGITIQINTLSCIECINAIYFHDNFHSKYIYMRACRNILVATWNGIKSATSLFKLKQFW